MRSLVLCFVTICLVFACEGQLPSYISVCYRDDPQVSECLKNAITNLLPIFKSGSADFDLEPLDPMTMENLVYQYKSSVIGGSFQITRAKITGLSNIQVLDVRTDLKNPKKFIMEFDANLPHMNVKAEYIMSGNVISIPVKMNGKVDMDFDELFLKYRIEGDVKRIGQFDYLILNSFTWRFRGEGMKNMILRNDDVVRGRPALNRVVTTIVKTAWRPLKDHILPSLLPETDILLKSMFVNFFKKYPYDILFPKRGRADDSEFVDDSDVVEGDTI